MIQSFEQAAAYIHALTGEPAETVRIHWRCIHDADKQTPAHKYYGTLHELFETLCTYNNSGYGVFCNINAFAPTATTHNLADVWYIRTHAIDLDNTLTSQQNYQRAAASNPPPCFAVNTSPLKHHVYWPCPPYQGNERYNTVQRKLRQLFDGDKAVIDPTRVLRVPGFFNNKYSLPASDKYNGSAPYLVTCHSLPGYLNRQPVEAMEAALIGVNVIDAVGGRHALGDPELAAPSLEWLRFALSLIDPNNLDRGEWISCTAAIKQAGWTLASEQELRGVWEEWCARYQTNDPGENDKNWTSVRDTEVGWKSICRRAPTLAAYEKFGFKETPVPAILPPIQQPQPPSAPTEPEIIYPDILSDVECRSYFHNCFAVERFGEILTPNGRFMNATQFNMKYGGKLFVIDPNGKTTDEPWKAATRSTLWTIPKVDHIRFVPQQPQFAILEDQLGRRGVNTYIPIRLRHSPGDITPWLRHMELMLPVESDRQTIYAFLAHNVKYPGKKIPWAPLIQSAEGVGKGFIKKVIEGMLGEMYTYNPPAQELIGSSATFNSWQRGKLMIVVDEIKIDERRELIEIMKPWITDERIQIQSKGENQEMEDNPANYCFFSNYKDAIPIGQSGRRYSIFYSAIQRVEDLIRRGMDDAYFNALFEWRLNGGQEIIVDWLLNYPITSGGIPMRAPKTSSFVEAVRVSRGPVEVAIMHAIEDQAQGFRGGYVSLLAVMSRLKNVGVRTPARATVERILDSMGYTDLGRAVRQYGQESMQERTQVFGVLPDLPVEGYGRAQGFE